MLCLSVYRMVQSRCAVTVAVLKVRQQNCRSRSCPSYLPTVWGEIIIKYVNLMYSTTAVQNSYCYCMDVADGELFSGTAGFVTQNVANGEFFSGTAGLVNVVL